MNRVGIRDLKQNASAVIHRVTAGETVEVTDRGRPVAHIVPLSAAGGLDQMVADGRATRAHGDILDVTPMTPPPRRPLLSQVLAEMRADER
ncbi:MAG: type II toxin-antitoxin system Phd/YefM family antitoxin [Candidatus Dormibacteria bacterium]